MNAQGKREKIGREERAESKGTGLEERRRRRRRGGGGGRRRRRWWWWWWWWCIGDYEMILFSYPTIRFFDSSQMRKAGEANAILFLFSSGLIVSSFLLVVYSSIVNRSPSSLVFLLFLIILLVLLLLPQSPSHWGALLQVLPCARALQTKGNGGYVD